MRNDPCACYDEDDGGGKLSNCTALQLAIGQREQHYCKEDTQVRDALTASWGMCVHVHGPIQYCAYSRLGSTSRLNAGYLVLRETTFAVAALKHTESRSGRGSALFAYPRQGQHESQRADRADQRLAGQDPAVQDVLDGSDRLGRHGGDLLRGC